MSIKTLSLVEAQRDTETPTEKAGNGDKPKSEMLVDSIPTEILAPYTAILALVVANAESGEWETERWWIYGVSLALVPVLVFVLWTREKSASAERRLPVAGMFGAAVAFAAWGLIMPGAPLTYAVTDGGDLSIWTGIITAAATGVLTMLPLNRQTKKSS